MTGDDRKDAPAAPPLPDLVERFRASYGAVWDGYEDLARRTQVAGPLDEKTQRLVKLGIAIGARLVGATHSHVRKCLAAGVAPAEIEHVAVLALTTLGLPNMMAAYGWVTETVDNERERKV
jgi:alkylhydroperoxidase/carboxymuconolactone decarboxylase family protein YurZ